MAQLSLQDDKLCRCWPQLSQNCFFLKMVRFEMVNLGLCFTVKIGFQSADAIITNGLKEEFEISGIYTLLVAVIAYFVLLRMLLLDLFSTGKYRKKLPQAWKNVLNVSNHKSRYFSHFSSTHNSSNRSTSSRRSTSRCHSSSLLHHALFLPSIK